MTTYFGNYNSLQTFLRENYKDSNLCKSLDEDFVKGKMSIIYDENGELRWKDLVEISIVDVVFSLLCETVRLRHVYQ